MSDALADRMLHVTQEHQPNYVVEPDGSWRIKCEGESCGFYLEDRRNWYRMMDEWSAHLAEVMTAEMMQVMRRLVRETRRETIGEYINAIELELTRTVGRTDTTVLQNMTELTERLVREANEEARAR